MRRRSGIAVRSRSRPFSRLASIATVALLAGACAVDVKDGVGPLAPEPDVEGTVSRNASPAIRLDVELHNVATDLKVFETESNVNGAFGFFDVPPGLWELRVESDVPGDFAAVTRQFYRGDEHGRFQAGAFDVFAHGAALDAPAAGAVLPVATPFDPIDFFWTLPDKPGVVARVDLFDLNDQDVWKSAWVATDSVRFNGYGTEGAYFGLPVGPGLYEWRVKFLFPDTTEARTQRRTLRLE